MEQVSIVIPSYNHSLFIDECLLSAYNQTYENIELVIVDDGSTDNSADLINEFIHAYGKRFINVQFIQQENKGVSAALNKAFSLCSSEWVYYLASDDVFMPGKITIQQSAISELDSVALVYTDYYQINDNSERQPIVNRWNVSPEPDNQAYEWLYFRCPIIPSTVAINRKAFLSVGGFDESLKIEDWDLFLRLSVNYSVARIPHRLSCYRHHKGNASHDKKMVLDNITKTLDKFLTENKDLVTESMHYERMTRQD